MLYDTVGPARLMIIVRTVRVVRVVRNVLDRSGRSCHGERTERFERSERSMEFTPQGQQLPDRAQRVPACRLSGFARKVMNANFGHLRAVCAGPREHLDIDECTGTAKLRQQPPQLLESIDLEPAIDIANADVEKNPS